ncbi:hypothetical protein [Leifsonia sp. Leaf264]|uniref:hypothetical protein n=1 Tax=Leifsonia sp. Leaf264 TaxID=1736314 RepID=UPI0006F80704|nr:hypothetical protein [Leifsonia sp. Leaf264]KQO98183.1 hypothetical protein ASF30_08980 [Leifsonia sp. Leaf264]
MNATPPRIPKPDTHVGPTKSKADSGFSGKKDPGLQELTHFSVQINDPVRIATPFGYNDETHKYKKEFVNPREFRFALNARDGLNSYRSRTVAKSAFLPALKAKPGFPGKPGRIDDLKDELAPPDPIDPGSGDGPPLYPDELAAFVWTVTQKGGPYHERKIVPRKMMPMEVSGVSVPEPGTYVITLRAVTNDNRFFERSMQVTFRSLFFASIGDSSASGQGNPQQAGSPDFNLQQDRFCRNATFTMAIEKASVKMSNPVEWMEAKAYRSMGGAPSVAAISLDNSSATTKRGSVFELDVITYVTVARSGAAIIEGLLNTQTQPPNDDFIGVGQIDELERTAKGRRIDVLMIDIGGNDCGFSDVFKDLVSGDNVFTAGLPGLASAALDTLAGTAGIDPSSRPTIGDDRVARNDVEERLIALLAPGGQVEVNFNSLKARLDTLNDDLGVESIFITGYPIGIFQSKRDGDLVFESCGVFSGPDLDLSGADIELVVSQGFFLNALIQRKAEQFGWHYVEPVKAFQGHGYCADDSWWVSAETSCMQQGDFEGMVHPNHEGHKAWGKEFAKSIREHAL